MTISWALKLRRRRVPNSETTNDVVGAGGLKRSKAFFLANSLGIVSYIRLRMGARLDLPNWPS